MHDNRAFRDALGAYPTGVTVVTCMSEDGPLAITANSFASVSLDPPLVLWSPAKASPRHDPFVTAQHSAIHVLCAESQDLAQRFAQDGFDFSHCTTVDNSAGTPCIPQALARFDCVAHAAHDAGDHTILVARVTGFTQREGQPLVFAQGRYQSLAAR